MSSSHFRWLSIGARIDRNKLNFSEMKFSNSLRILNLQRLPPFYLSPHFLFCPVIRTNNPETICPKTFSSFRFVSFRCATSLFQIEKLNISNRSTMIPFSTWIYKYTYLIKKKKAFVKFHILYRNHSSKSKFRVWS